MPKHRKNIPLIRKAIQVINELRGNTPLSEVTDDTKVHVNRMASTLPNFNITTLDILCNYFKIKKSDFFKRIEELEEESKMSAQVNKTDRG